MCHQCQQLAARIEMLERLVLTLGERLAIVAEHLGRLAERPDKRNVGHKQEQDCDLR